MPAPQFVIVHRGGEENKSGAAGEGAGATGPTDPADPAGGSRVGAQIENLVNDLLRNFMQVFSGQEFLRMQMQYNDFNPNNFMQNFQ
jgi:hypothetical protein